MENWVSKLIMFLGFPHKNGKGGGVMVGAMKCSWPKVCAEGGFRRISGLMMNVQNQQIRSFGEGIPLCTNPCIDVDKSVR